MVIQISGISYKNKKDGDKQKPSNATSKLQFMEPVYLYPTSSVVSNSSRKITSLCFNFGLRNDF